MVLDSVRSRRTVRNLWGLKPVQRQELFHWSDGGGLFPESTFVGGRHLGIYSELGELGETMVGDVMDEFGEYDLVSEKQEGHKTPTIATTLVYRSPTGVEFRRLSFRENRIQYIGDPEEFVPGFSPVHDILWDVVFPK